MRTVPRRVAVIDIGGIGIDVTDIARAARDVVVEEMLAHSQGDDDDKHRQDERRGTARAKDASALNHAGTLPRSASSRSYCQSGRRRSGGSAAPCSALVGRFDNRVPHVIASGCAGVA